MSIRVRRPDVDRLELSRGDWILVKRYLTAGEHQEYIRQSVKPVSMAAAAGATPGEITAAAGRLGVDLDLTAAGQAEVLAYLVDWSFQDADGRPLEIMHQPAAVVRACLHAIDADSYMEVQRAIQAHKRAIDHAIAEEKKLQTGAPDSSRTLISVAP